VLVNLLIAVAIGFVVSQLANLATTVYLHRTLAHHAVTMRAPLAWCYRFLLWITTGLKAREWVAVHRKHHAYTDTEGDPHSPKLLGWVRVQFTSPALYRMVASDEATTEKYAKDLPPDKWDRMLFDRAFVGLALGIGILIVALGPIYGLIAAFIHTNAYLGLSGAVNAIGHRFGKRPSPNSATNLGWLALITAGEGWHNNHHARPTSARLGWTKSQIDLGWWTIKLHAAMGMAKIRQTLPGRPAASAAS